jgi:hypothetical protein
MQARDLNKKDKCNDFLKYKGTLNLFFSCNKCNY